MKPASGFSNRDGHIESLDTSSPADAQLMHQVRLTVSGALASSILHEFANLLTIVDGSRQVARMGLKPPDSSIIDPTADRCGELVTAFRSVLSAPRCAGIPVRVQHDVAGIAALVEARLRGGMTQVRLLDIEASVTMLDSVSAPLRLGWFAVILGEIERQDALGCAIAEVRLGAESDRSRLGLAETALSAHFRIAGSRQRPDPDAEITHEELSKVGEALLRSMGAEFSRAEEVKDSRDLRVRIPASPTPRN